MKLSKEINHALFDLMNELHDRQEAFGEQIQRDMNYVMALRQGNSDDGKGVTPELKLKADKIFLTKQ